MSLHFSVNGKVYLPSSTLAASSGYTSDYLGKLAREEKVLGSLVGRQWFIEPESLNVFLHKVKVEKEIRQEELRYERKLAHAASLKKSTVSKSPVQHPLFSLDVLAQTFVILCCGVFIGGLGFLVVDEKIGIQEIVSGASRNLTDIRIALAPTQKVINANITPDSSVAASSEGILTQGILQERTPHVFTVLPIFPERSVDLISTTTSTRSTVLEEKISFSDEVRVIDDEHGNQFIVPIFKNRVDNQNRFLVIPVTPEEN